MHDFSCSYDVVVCGGGVAGAAAALQSARRGCRTALIEKTVFLGGLATSGLIYVYLPLCDGRGRQMIHGISEEMLRHSMKYGPGEIPPGWSRPDNNDPAARCQVSFSPASFILALDEMCESAGVDIWLDTMFCSVETDANSQIRSVFVENKSGRGKINARVFVEATGDADLARRSGAELESASNHLSSWVLEYDVRARARDGGLSLADRLGLFILHETVKEQDAPDIRDRYRDIDGKKVSKFLLETRRKIRGRYLTEHERGDVSRHEFFPIALPSMPSFRMTYAVRGKNTLEGGQEGARFEDSIGLAGDWRRPGPVWEIPYGALVPEKIRGLLAAGRCISSIGDAWEVTRVIPVAAMTGQAAGMAAALSVENNTLPDRLDVGLLQSKLREIGVPLHLSDVGL